MQRYISNIVIFFGIIISLIIVTLLWSKINIPYSNPGEVIGAYSRIKISHYNNLLRFLFFIGLPILVFLFLYLILKRKKCFTFKEILIDDNFDRNENLNLNFLLFFFILFTILFFLSSEFGFYKLDNFHEGLELSGGYNSYITKKYWGSSYIQNSLFSDFLNAKISWFLSGNISIGSIRANHVFLKLITEILIIFFCFSLTRSLNLEKEKEIIFFTIICALALHLNREITQYFYPVRFRDIPLIIFLIFSLRMLTIPKNNYISCLTIGILSIFSIIWSLEKGIYLNISLLCLLFLFFLKKRNKQIFLISSSIIISWIFFYFMVGNDEFSSFIINTVNIIRDQDWNHGLIYPAPFIFDFNEHAARGTKSLLIIILNGILIVELVLNKKSKVPRQSKLFLCIFFLMALVNYKTGLLRSDSFHMRQGIYFQFILFIFLLTYYLTQIRIMNLSNKNKYISNKFVYIIICLFIFTYINQNNFKFGGFKNIKNFRDRYIDYVSLNDNFFLTNEYINLKDRLIELSDKENCFQIVTYDSTINYLIKKQSCTKYFIINALGSKQIQEKFIYELDNIRPKYILINGPLDNMNVTPSERFPYLFEYLLKSYKLHEKFGKWNILYLKN